MADVTRFCYIVMAHRDPQLVLRLVRRIRSLSPSCDVLVRHDRGGHFFPPGALAAAGAVELSSHTSVVWGDWTMVEAMLEAFSVARSTFDADWFVLVSGQDYPLRRLSTWEAEVARGGHDALVDTVDDDPAPRATLRWRRLPHGRTGLPHWARRLLQRTFYVLVAPRTRRVQVWPLPRGLGWAVGLPRRQRYPAGLHHQKGSQFMTLSARALDEVLRQHREHPERAEYFATTFIPDESYLQTVLASTPTLRVARLKTTQADIHGDSAHPGPLDLPSARLAADAGVPFGRKIEPGVNEHVADAVDAVLDGDGQS